MKKRITQVCLLLLCGAAVIAIYRFNFRKSIPGDGTREDKIAHIFKNNDCLACHSNNPEKPFYGSFPVIGNQVDRDIEMASRYMKFDEIDLQNINEADLAKIEQTMLSGSMPVAKYKMIHWGTGFNNAEKSLIAGWIRDVRSERFSTGLACEMFINEPVQPIVEFISVNEEKVSLGYKLYHDGRLSADGTVSCATCHPLDNGGVDGTRTSKGIYGQFGGINAPTVYNAVFNHVQFWNGRAATLADQAAGPPVNPVEMGMPSWAEIVENLKGDKCLVDEFSALYAEGMTEKTITDAIAEFEKTLITPNSPFDKYLKGDMNALTASQIKGYDLFKSNNCASCHVGQALGGQSFEYLGIMDDYFAARPAEIVYNDDDKGLYGFTGKESDLHKFKTPTLRNIALTAPYMHDGTAQTLDEAVKIMLRFQTGTKYTQNDVDNMVDFLESLTGENKHM